MALGIVRLIVLLPNGVGETPGRGSGGGAIIFHGGLVPPCYLLLELPLGASANMHLMHELSKPFLEYFVAKRVGQACMTMLSLFGMPWWALTIWEETV